MKKKTIIPYRQHLVEKARQLRNNATFAERVLWKHLKRRQLKGYDFDRQKSVDKYIVDFFCNELLLVIEIDGISHNDRRRYDMRRQQRLEDLGMSVLRFDGYLVIENTAAVVQFISDWIDLFEQQKKPTPGPSQEGD